MPQLKPAPGLDAVVANCQLCHSLDYISTQPPLNRAAWTAIIQKTAADSHIPAPHWNRSRGFRRAISVRFWHDRRPLITAAAP